MNSKNRDKHKTNPISFIEGNRAFRRIAEEFKELLKIYGYDESADILERQKAINFVYNCVFFGSHSDGLTILKAKFSNKNNELEGKMKTFLEADGDANSFVGRKAVYNETIKYYGGHARRLGHYFRNIYQAVKYVDEQKFLTPKQKYDYVTILRAQMSVYEQEVFFYNSLSDLGGIWEWEHLQRNEYPQSTQLKHKLFNKLWVTKYDFIRNLLNHEGVLSTGINLKKFYPILNLEREKEFEQCDALPFKDNLDKKVNICRFCFNKKYIRYYEGEKDELKKAEEEIKETFPSGIRIGEWPCQENPCETIRVVNKFNLGLK